MRTRTIVAVILAIVIGVCASIATYRLTNHQPHSPAKARDDADVGLTP
ncbi:MAG TPA: hypothetical protein VN814_00490 [Caulobacteraceae bacterium]|nr:hypothetical protein [Caulobacteraceae bacterium]